MSEAPKKVKVPKDGMERINKNMKIYRTLGAPEDEVIKYLYECIKAYGEYEALSEHYVAGLSNSMKAYKEYFEREEERVMELFAAEPKVVPERKPMTEEEIDSKFELDGSMFSSYTAFKQGVRCAEEFHGIGGGDE